MKQKFWFASESESDSLTEEHKQKIADALKGHKVSEETAKKISEANKGRVAYNKGKPAPVHLCMHCKKEIAGYSNFSRWHGTIVN